MLLLENHHAFPGATTTDVVGAAARRASSIEADSSNDQQNHNDDDNNHHNADNSTVSVSHLDKSRLLLSPVEIFNNAKFRKRTVDDIWWLWQITSVGFSLKLASTIMTRFLVNDHREDKKYL